MARGRSRRSGEYGEFWPAYVDVLSTLLLVVTLLMSIFMIAQYFSAQEVTGKDSALQRLTAQISELTSMLSLEKGKSQSAQDELAALQATLSSLKAENEKLTGAGLGADERAKSAEGQIAGLTAALDKQKNLSNEALSKVDLLNQQLVALRRQIAALNDALEASEKKGAESDKTIKDLGARLNTALAQQVQELKRYRSDFFGRLRTLLKDRKDIRVVGDRFVFESEVLFPSGSATLTPEGMAAMDQIAEAIVELQKEIPPDIDWALQINGHTDARPISNSQFASNWELSTARAASVVKYLVSRGVPADRLVAAGYAEFQPVDSGHTEEAYQKNRRIELKLTNR
ncbi:peptidoglycan -binding protein [Hyphomicrobium sp. B1]|uniref:peptidoglycan -binding protein n=1 Tax=Hyphomicrobium sp. B1 TaxID=3075651 RepID=UPI003C2E0AD6